MRDPPLSCNHHHPEVGQGHHFLCLLYRYRSLLGYGALCNLLRLYRPYDQALYFNDHSSYPYRLHKRNFYSFYRSDLRKPLPISQVATRLYLKLIEYIWYAFAEFALSSKPLRIRK